MQGLNELEKQAVGMLLAGDDPILDLLRRQYSVAQVTGREFTGAGFFTNFFIPDKSLLIPSRKSFAFGDVSIEIEGLEHGGGFVLHIQRGVLGFLEAFTYDEEWPREIRKFTLSYMHGKRDLEALRKRWS